MSRYEKGHKADTHRRVVEIAAQRFRAEGIDSVGVASLMADAGLTHGGFYAHFPSKEALVKEALIAAIGSSFAYDNEAEATAPLNLRAFIDFYLSPAHRDKPATGCAVATLGAETTRRPRATRNAFNKEAQRFVARIASGLPEEASPEHKLAKAYGVFAQLVGSLQLSRIVTDKTLSDEVLAVGRSNALQLAGLDQGEETKAKPAKRTAKKH
ncbi:Transcriptional regulator, TetR family [Methylocella tundrae]|uniref:Transcriptional regulator, TetR family n=1 Tax=Methylocella tundrae TaxID=227605 RepID=A0A8B6M2V0_METTU|nr:TetR/AcrR family transcriptional regulator [Methylocella tundrae]VTZ26710.1 Transcriptional regulator, TetR family [Methylocella tundrae]VTZ48472.1 Transcriptional regulator, TetR family [Methylocella tundrae]